MNSICKVVWSDIHQQLVVVSELVKSGGKTHSSRSRSGASAGSVKTGDSVLSLKTLCWSLALGLGMTTAQAQLASNALPTGGSVSAGQASISQSGANMVINQSSQRAAINWQSFNVGAKAQVQFNNGSGITLNRVTGPQASTIAGRISATGQVIISNGNGVLFTPGSRIDVGGLVATTHSISDQAFMAGGDLRFERNGSTASLVNEGELSARLQGYVALLAPEVRNSGVIVASKGTVALAAGEAITLRLNANEQLQGVVVEAGAWQALVENRHVVEAEGGLVILSARALQSVQSGVVRHSGSISASSLTEVGGRIVLMGDDITLAAGSTLTATGAKGGGQVLVGGDWQGGANAERRVFADPNAVYQARKISMEQGASIDASATDNGNGGTVVLWSDVGREGGRTEFAGQILARGGLEGGRGGQVETSGHVLQVAGTSRVDTTAAKGATGEWLLDPIDFTISAGAGAQTTSGIGADTLVANLASNDITIATDASTAGNGDITVAATVNSTAPAATSLTLTAHRNITVSAGVEIAVGGAINFNAGGNISLNESSGAVAKLTSRAASGAGITLRAVGSITQQRGVEVTTNGANVTYWSNTASDTTGDGGIKIGNASSSTPTAKITTAGGNIVLTGGTGADPSVGYAISRSTAFGFDTTDSYGIGIFKAVLDTSTAGSSPAGDITIRGSSSLAGYGLSVGGTNNTIASSTLFKGRNINLVSNTTTTTLFGFKIRGNIEVLGGTLTLENNSGSSASTFSGVISGSGAVTKTGVGGITFSGLNSYTGVTTISGGTLKMGAAGDGTNTPLGTNAAGTVVASGASLDLGGFSLSTTEALTINGNGAYLGALFNGSGTVTYSGLLTLGSDARIYANQGSINLSNTGTISGSGYTLTLGGQGGSNNSLAGVLSLGAGGLTTLFTGDAYTWTLSGANAYTGPTTLAGGTIKTTHSSAFGSNSALSITLANSAQSPQLDISGGNLNIGSLASSGASGASTRVPVVLGSSTLTAGANNGTTTFAGVISGDGALAKVGTGTLTLSGANTYTGNTTVSGGTLAVTNATGLGTTAAGTAVASGATLDLRGVTVGAEALTLNGGTLATNSGTSSLSGTVAMGADSTVNVSGTQLTLSGVVSGTGFGLTKTGAGALTLSGSNSYSGLTTVSAGTLKLGAAGDGTNTPLGTVAAGTVMASGATLDLNGYNLSTAEALIINGSGVSNAGALANSSATSATYSGLLTLGSNATILAGTGITGNIVLTNPGTITGSGFSLTLDGTGSASSLASIVGTGSGNLIKAGSGTWTLTGDNTYTGTTTITAGILGVGSGGTTGRLGSGALAIGTASLIINRSDNVSLSTLVPNGGSVNIARQGYVRVSTGGLTLDRSITASGQIELISSGNIISTTGYVQGNSLLLQGSNITLTHASNSINTLAAVATGSLTFTESNVLTIGTYSGVSGLTAGGAISVSTATGNLTVSANVSTTDTTAYAILLNAGRTTAAGTSTGGDLIVSGTPTLTAGTGGTIRLMTGSVSGSTGLTALVGSGTGRFRYNSDEVADRYTTALSPNVINAIYRESRAVTVSGLGSTVTYGDTLSPSASGTVNGDTISLVVGSPLYSSAGLLRYQGTPYNLSSNLSGLGYIVTGLPATLTVNRKDLTVTGLNSADKVYDGSNAASLSGTAALQTAVTVGGGTSSDGAAYSGDLVNLLGTPTGTFNSKDVAMATTVTAGGLALAGADAGNYSLTPWTQARAITAKPLSITAPSIANKVYDGSTAAGALTQGTVSGLVTGENLTVSGSAAALSSANAGSYTTTVNYTLANGAGGTASNYSLAASTGVSATIDRATLTVRANDDAKFVTQSDAVNFAGVSYAGFVNGETAAVLSGTPTVTRTNAGTSVGGTTYTGVLQPGGLTPGNYQFNYVNGDFTVVGSNQMLVRVTNASTTYGTDAAYSLTSAAYYNGAIVVTLGAGTGSITSLGNNQFTVADGAGGSATFTVVPSGNQITSGAGKLKVGSYQLDPSGVSTVNANNFSNNLVMVGSHTVSPKTLTASLSNPSKVYDGSQNLPTSGMALAGKEAGDVVTVSGTGSLASRNVGTGLSYTVSNLALAGADAVNYQLGSSSLSGTNGVITRLNSVTWVAGSTGNWFDPANWAGGAVPDLSNVANVIIPTGVTVSFNNTAVSPAVANQVVNIDSLGSAGALTQSHGILNIGSGGLALASYTQNGGTLTNAGTTVVTNLTQSGGSFSGTGAITAVSLSQTGGTLAAGGNLTVSTNFSQGSSGSITVAGNASITDTTGGTVIGNLTTMGTTNITSTGGDITQASGTAIVSTGAATLAASNGGVTANITLDNAGNDFGSVSATGRGITLRDVSGMDVALNASGNGALTADGNLVVSGTTQDLTTTTTNGGTSRFGDTTVRGALNSTSAGNISQTGPLRVAGATTLSAGGGAGVITLTHASNNLSGAVVTNAASANVVTSPAQNQNQNGNQSRNTTADLDVSTQVALRVSAAGHGARADSPGMKVSGISPTRGVIVTSKVPVQQTEPIVVAVSLPYGSVNTVQGFSFDLPEAVRMAAPEGVAVQATRADGSELPVWLKFDRSKMRLLADVVPSDALPLQIAVTIGGQRVLVQISERAE